MPIYNQCTQKAGQLIHRHPVDAGAARIRPNTLRRSQKVPAFAHQLHQAARSWALVSDAKYHYNFWRPITSIRNGDIDGNPATDREATWQPIDNTPMHPEYPCAHCILSGTVSGVIKAALGTVDIPEIAITSATASGVAHRWTNLTAFTEEVANGRIWAGFHYRFLNSRRHGYGAADRRIRCEERDAASRDEFTLNEAQHCDAGSFHKRIPAIARDVARTQRMSR